MALGTYNDLKTAVASWLNRNDSNLPTTDFIDLGEAELNSRVRVRQNMTTAVLTLAQGASSVTLPSDCLEEIEFNYATSDDSLDRASFNDVDFARGSGDTGRPAAYAIAGTTIVFNCIADAAYTFTLRYYKAWDIAADSTNWLLTNHPDCYLFGALAEANAWLGDIAQAEYARSRRDAAVIRALAADSRTKGARLRVDAALLTGGRYNVETDD